MIQLYTGNGKGKTTAAIGQAIRAAGAGMKVAFYQFLKHGAFMCSEEAALKKISNIRFIRFKQHSPLFDPGVSAAKLEQQVKKDWKTVVKAIKSGKYGLIVLDELTHVINLKLIDEKEILKVIKNSQVNFVLTGRNASKGLIKAADLVTEMKEIKHPYRKGLRAKRGIDF